MLNELLVLLIINIGLLCTIFPNLYGTVLIFFGVTLYAISREIELLQSNYFYILLLLSFLAEGITWGISYHVKRKYQVSPYYSLDEKLCNAAGLVVFSTFFGSIAGAALWRGLISRGLLPHKEHVEVLFKVTIYVSFWRTLCAVIMSIIAIKYIIAWQ